MAPHARLVAQVIVLPLLATAWLSSAAHAQRQGPLRILVDQTREYSGAWMDLGEALPDDEYLVTQSFASVSGQPLDPFDILVVRYDEKDTVWSAPMTELVKRFVRTGGSLLLIAHGGHWYMGPRADAEYPIYQANRLAKSFDFWFEIEPELLEIRAPLALGGSPVAEGIESYTPAGAPGVLTDLTGSAKPIVESESGQLVIASRQYGRGRVVMCSDPGGLAPGGPNQALLESILQWLTPTEPMPVTDPPPPLILPDVTFYYQDVGVAIPDELTTGAQLLAFELALKDLGEATEALLGVATRGDYLVLVLPEGTPKLSPDAYIAYGATHEDLYPVLEAAARALAASCISPGQLPGMFQKAWEHYWAMKALGALGHTRATVAWKETRTRFEAIDEDRLTELDPLIVPEDPEVYQDTLVRAVFLLDAMQTSFGPRFLQNLAQRNRVDSPLRVTEPMSPAEFGDLVEAVGGYDARQWLRERGVEIPDEARPYSR